MKKVTMNTLQMCYLQLPSFTALVLRLKIQFTTVVHDSIQNSLHVHLY